MKLTAKGWIPVTVCLPDDDKKPVLFCGVRGAMYVGTHWHGLFFTVTSSGKVHRAVAWMHLPKPYEVKNERH